ncbi:MAG: HEPN domain-containing protein [Anaerolineae bacterium]|nr:HEPN domain-containing protein [Anaerolineae bacterium]
MTNVYTNPDIAERFEELILEGERQRSEQEAHNWEVRNPVELTRWTTSCLNLLDKLSISTNRFVTEFELYGRVKNNNFNMGLALGVLKSAKEEYLLGLAVDYQLSVSASVFSSILDEAQYLLSKGYLRASAVLAGAALEEGLKSRARVVGLEITKRDTLDPVIDKLKQNDVGILSEFDAKRLKSITTIRNDAAHGGEFPYQKSQVQEMITDVEKTINRLLGYR